LIYIVGALMTGNQVDQRKGAVQAIATEVFDIGEAQGPVHTFLHLLRAPVQRTMALVEDPAYRGHGKFFRFATFLYVAAAGFAATKLYSSDFWHSVMQHQPEGVLRSVNEFQTSHGAFMQPVIAYASFILYFALGYVIFSRLGQATRSSNEYLKLRCLSGGFTGLLFVPMTLLSIPYFDALGQLQKAVESGALEQLPAGRVLGIIAVFGTLSLVLMTCFTVYEVRIQKRFWQIGTLRAMVGSLLAILGVSALLFAVQTAFAVSGLAS
jgi:hypothetical protein